MSSSASSLSIGDVTLYYSESSSYSVKALIALYEKKVDFHPQPVDLARGQQYDAKHLELNPRGEVPVLVHGDTVVAQSNDVVEYIDRTFGRPHLLLPAMESDNAAVRGYVARVDSIPMFPITYGVALGPEGLTESLRFPYCRENVRASMRDVLSRRPDAIRRAAASASSEDVSRVLMEKLACLEEAIDVVRDRKRLELHLEQVESFLDSVEKALADESRLGPWLCGAMFSAADISLVMLLMRLFQLGLDERMWLGGRRPHLAMYQELAFRRPSVEKATKWRQHQNEVAVIPSSSSSPSAGLSRAGSVEALDAAKIGLGAVLVLGGMYVVKKLLRK